MLRDNASLQDIYNSGRIILKFAESLSRKDLGLDDSNTAGIVLHIMIIEEATKRLSPELRAQYPDIPYTNRLTCWIFYERPTNKASPFSDAAR